MPEDNRIQDLMSKSFLFVNQDKMLDASGALDNPNADFAVVRGDQGSIRALLNAADLKGKANRADLIASVPTPVSVDISSTMDQVVRMTAKDLVLNPKLSGVIILDHGNIVGVLPRTIVASYAASSVLRGPTGTLEGSPVDKLLYECPIDHERQEIDYYNPASPPRCRAGHLMDPVE